MTEHLNISFMNSVIGTRIPLFNSRYYDSGTTDWVGGMVSYSTAYTFGAFLVRNYGGVKLIAEMSRNKTGGIESINEALVACGYAETFDSVFREFSLALVRAESESLAGFNKALNDVEYGDYKYTLDPFDLWSRRVNGGPCCFDFSDEKTHIRPYGNKIYSDSSWSNITDSIFFEVGNSSEDQIKTYLVIR